MQYTIKFIIIILALSHYVVAMAAGATCSGDGKKDLQLGDLVMKGTFGPLFKIVAITQTVPSQFVIENQSNKNSPLQSVQGLDLFEISNSAFCDLNVGDYVSNSQRDILAQIHYFLPESGHLVLRPNTWNKSDNFEVSAPDHWIKLTEVNEHSGHHIGERVYYKNRQSFATIKKFLERPSLLVVEMDDDKKLFIDDIEKFHSILADEGMVRPKGTKISFLNQFSGSEELEAQTTSGDLILKRNHMPMKVVEGYEIINAFEEYYVGQETYDHLLEKSVKIVRIIKSLSNQDVIISTEDKNQYPYQLALEFLRAQPQTVTFFGNVFVNKANNEGLALFCLNHDQKNNHCSRFVSVSLREKFDRERNYTWNGHQLQSTTIISTIDLSDDEIAVTYEKARKNKDRVCVNMYNSFCQKIEANDAHAFYGFNHDDYLLVFYSYPYFIPLLPLMAAWDNGTYLVGGVQAVVDPLWDLIGFDKAMRKSLKLLDKENAGKEIRINNNQFSNIKTLMSILN